MSSREEILFLHYLQLQCLFRVMQKHKPIFSLINSMHLYDTKTGLILISGKRYCNVDFHFEIGIYGVPKELDERFYD